MPSEDDLLAEAGFVIASNTRTQLLKLLLESPATPSIVSSKLNTQTSHASRALSELQSHGLITCVNPTERKGRIYRITEYGIHVMRHVSIIHDY